MADQGADTNVLAFKMYDAILAKAPTEKTIELIPAHLSVSWRTRVPPHAREKLH